MLRWVKLFKNGPSKICGRQPWKNLKSYGLLKQTKSPQNFLKPHFHKFYLVQPCWIPWPRCVAGFWINLCKLLKFLAVYTVLCNLIPVVQLKKRKKYPWRSVTFSKATLLHPCFPNFFNCSNGTLLLLLSLFWFGMK